MDTNSLTGHYGCLNRHTLRLALDREGIRHNAYSIGGEERPESYCLGIVPGGWAVWYAERGHRNDLTVFDTEDEACSELLLKLINDPTTRPRPSNT